MLSAVPHRHQRLSLKHIVRRALCLLLLANVQAILFGEEPTASPQKPAQPNTEANDTAETRTKQLISKLQRPIDLKFEQKPLSDVLDSISRQHGMRIAPEFDAEIGTVAVSSNETGATLDDALENILKPLGLEAKNRDGILVIAPRATQATQLWRVIGKHADLKFENVPLKDVLAEIARRYEIRIDQNYGDRELGQKPLTIEMSEPLFAALRRILKPLDLEYTIHREHIVVDRQKKLSADDLAAYEWFKQPITGKWKDSSLQQVLWDISRQQGMELHCDKSLEDTDAPVTLTVIEEPLGDVLERILDPLGFIPRVQQGQVVVVAWPGIPQTRDPEIESSLRQSDRVDFVDFPLRRALRKLSDRHNVKFILNIPDEGADGVTPSTPITLALNDYTLRGTLRRLLEPLRLTFEIRDHAIWVVEVPDPE